MTRITLAKMILKKCKIKDRKFAFLTNIPTTFYKFTSLFKNSAKKRDWPAGSKS